MRARTFTAVLLLAIATPVHAGQVDRAKVTLGALVDEADRVVLARVEATSETSVTLAVLETVKGGSVARLTLPRDGEVAWKEGERVLVSVRLDASGEPLALGSVFEKIDATAEATATELVRAARERLPRLDEETGALRLELYRELDSAIARLREDAALELSAHRELAANDDERAYVGRALTTRGATPELLEVVRRLAPKALLEPTLKAARAAEDDATRAAAARALDAIDRTAALRALGDDLAGKNDARSLQAARLLGSVSGEEAALLLARRLDDGRPAIRTAALKALGGSEGARSVTEQLEGVMRQPQTPEEGELAAAVLARSGGGAALARAEANEATPERLRELVMKLRAEPVAASGVILGR